MSENDFQRQVLERLDRYEQVQTLIHDAIVGKIDAHAGSHVPGMLATMAKHHEALYGANGEPGIIRKVEGHREFQIKAMAIVSVVIVLLGLLTEFLKGLIAKH